MLCLISALLFVFGPNSMFVVLSVVLSLLLASPFSCDMNSTTRETTRYGRTLHDMRLGRFFYEMLLLLLLVCVFEMELCLLLFTPHHDGCMVLRFVDGLLCTSERFQGWCVHHCIAFHGLILLLSLFWCLVCFLQMVHSCREGCLKKIVCGKESHATGIDIGVAAVERTEVWSDGGKLVREWWQRQRQDARNNELVREKLLLLLVLFESIYEKRRCCCCCCC